MAELQSSSSQVNSSLFLGKGHFSSLRDLNIQNATISPSWSSWCSSSQSSSLRNLNIPNATISSIWLSSWCSSSPLKFPRIGEFLCSPELGDPQSLPYSSEDWVNNGRSNDSISPDREEDNHVSSVPDGGGIEEQERRAGETPGQSTLIAHGTDGGGIEEQERRAGETPGPSTVISHGTDGLESFVQSVIVQWLREHVNLDNREKIFQDFDLESVLRPDTLYLALLNQIINNVRIDLSRMLETNPDLSSEDLEVYCVPLCWSSKERVDFWLDLSEKLFLRAKAPNPPAEQKELMLELERTWQLHFGGQWVDRKGRQDFGEEWFHKIDELWITNSGRSWINKIDREWINIIEDEYRPCGSYRIFVRGLLRFVRNRWHHLDEFQESHGLRSAESFYNYLDVRFRNLLMVSYGVAYRFCKDERWFEKYKKNLCRSNFGRHAP